MPYYKKNDLCPNCNIGHFSIQSIKDLKGTYGKHRYIVKDYVTLFCDNCDYSLHEGESMGRAVNAAIAISKEHVHEYL